jgi:hypothetical protein
MDDLNRKSILKNRTLIFLHIPKCAGNSLIDLLQSHIPRGRILKGHLLHADAPGINKPFDYYRLIVGHNTYYDMSRLPVNPLYITMLRNPVDRIVSLYYFWRSHRDAYIEQHNLIGPRMAKQLSLEDFIECDAPEAALNIRNAQAGQFHNGLRGSPGLSDEELFETARQRLDECAFVGISEEFDPSIDLLCDLFKWQRPDTLRCVNDSHVNEQEDPRYEPTERPPLADGVLERLTELNQADIRLYEVARETFKRRYQDMRIRSQQEEPPQKRSPPLLSYRFRRCCSDLRNRLVR